MYLQAGAFRDLVSVGRFAEPSEPSCEWLVSNKRTRKGKFLKLWRPKSARRGSGNSALNFRWFARMRTSSEFRIRNQDCVSRAELGGSFSCFKNHRFPPRVSSVGLVGVVYFATETPWLVTPSFCCRDRMWHSLRGKYSWLNLGLVSSFKDYFCVLCSSINFTPFGRRDDNAPDLFSRRNWLRCPIRLLTYYYWQVVRIAWIRFALPDWKSPEVQKFYSRVDKVQTG